MCVRACVCLRTYVHTYVRTVIIDEILPLLVALQGTGVTLYKL